MNFLEGLKRLFVVFSLIVIAAAAAIGSENGKPPYWCAGELVIPANPPAQPQSGPWGKYQSLKPFNGKLDDPCRTAWMTWGKQVAYGAEYAAVAAAVMFILWLCLRWVIVGFFPSAARKT